MWILRAVVVGGLSLFAPLQTFAQSSDGIDPDLENESQPPLVDALLETTTEDEYFDANLCAGFFYIIKDHSDIMPSDRALLVYEGLQKVLDQAQQDILLAGVEIEDQTRVANYWDVTGRRRAEKYIATRNPAELRFDVRKCIPIAQRRVRLITKY